ncbi:MAG: hypothetical protein V7607_866 [Solirubrobacteraceae bacterium]
MGPSVSPDLEVSLEPTHARAGAPVIGVVTIRGGGEAGSLSVTLAYRERADYALDTPPFAARAISQELPLAGGAPADGDTYPFSLRLPEDALPNYRSKHGELCWELEARWAGSGDDATATARVESAASVAA